MLGHTVPAFAACSPSTPTAGQTVTCTGATTTGISGNASNVTVSTDNTTDINTTGVSAIDLGTGATITAASSSIIRSNVSTITVDGGSTITSFANSTISSTTGPAIQYTGAAGSSFTLTASGNIIGGAGIAVDFGQSSALLSLTPTHNFTGNVVAGSGTNDILRLSSSSNGTFNVSDIGTKYLGFDTFQKNGTSIWTLTGTGNQAWNVSNGTLIGTIDNLNAAITNNGIVNFQNTTGTYSAVMSGTGVLVKSGTGTLTLTGVNTYSGGTSVTGGALVISSDSNVGSGGISLASATLGTGASMTSAKNIAISGAGGTINTGAFNSNFTGVISGTGSLTKTGSGTLTLSGNNTYSGATSVTAGTLKVNGSILSAVTVDNGARLGGTGTVGAVTNNGTLAAGNSIGTLTVNGALVFNAGSSYEVEVDAAGNADKTVATGAITINGGSVNVKAASGNYNTTTDYTILEGLSRTGTFSSITTDLMFLTPSLTYGANDVVLTLTRNNTNFSEAAQDPSAVEVANAVQELGTGNDLAAAFMNLNQAQATQALQTLSGEHNAGIASAAVTSSGQVQTVIANRIQALLGRFAQGNKAALHMAGNDDGAVVDVNKQAFAMLEPAAGGILAYSGSDSGIWSEVFGLHGSSDSRGTAPGQNRESAGLLFGMDKFITPLTQLGVFGGWETGEVYTDSQSANSDVESWHGGLYLNHALSPRWRVSASLAGSYQEVDSTRHVVFPGFSETARGETHGYSASGFLETGYAMEWNDLALEPFANVNLIHSYVDDYNESDGGSASLVVDDATVTTPGHVIGLRAGKNVPVDDDTSVDLHAKIGWEHRYGDLSDRSSMRFQGGTSVFHVSGTPVSRDTAILGAGADLDLNAGTRAYVGYDGSFSRDERNHGVTLGIKVSF